MFSSPHVGVRCSAKLASCCGVVVAPRGPVFSSTLQRCQLQLADLGRRDHGLQRCCVGGDSIWAFWSSFCFWLHAEHMADAGELRSCLGWFERMQTSGDGSISSDSCRDLELFLIWWGLRVLEREEGSEVGSARWDVMRFAWHQNPYNARACLLHLHHDVVAGNSIQILKSSGMSCSSSFHYSSRRCTTLTAAAHTVLQAFC